MRIDIIDGQETLVTGLGSVPFWLYEDDIVCEHFWSYTDADELDKPAGERVAKHIALVCCYRKSLHSTPEDRHQFFTWVYQEFRRLITPKIHAQAKGDKLVIVQHIKKYQQNQPKEYYRIIDKIYTIAKTEKFLQHVFDAYWLADNLEDEDIYEILSSANNDDPEADNTRAENAWFHDHKSNKRYATYEDNDLENELVDQQWAEYEEYWKQFPVYKNDCRQYLIHQNLKVDRDFATRLAAQRLKEKLAEKKGKRKKHRRHR